MGFKLFMALFPTTDNPNRQYQSGGMAHLAGLLASKLGPALEPSPAVDDTPTWQSLCHPVCGLTLCFFLYGGRYNM